VLDFLSTTDVGRWVPAEEEDAVSEVLEQEVGITTVPSHAGLHGVGGRGQGRGRILSFVIQRVSTKPS